MASRLRELGDPAAAPRGARGSRRCPADEPRHYFGARAGDRGEGRSARAAVGFTVLERPLPSSAERRPGIVHAGQQPGARELACVAIYLHDRLVREAMFALATGPRASAAQQLWQILTRALEGIERAEPAILLGFSAYLCGDGPLAGIALDLALDAHPGHPTATLLDDSLRSGKRPSQLQDLVQTGLHASTELRRT